MALPTSPSAAGESQRSNTSCNPLFRRLISGGTADDNGLRAITRLHLEEGAKAPKSVRGLGGVLDAE